MLKIANNAYHLVSIGKNIQFEKKNATTDILFGSFLLHNPPFLQHATHLGLLYPWFLKCSMYPENTNVTVVPPLVGDLVGDVNLLVGYL